MRYPLSALTLHRKSGAVAAGRNFEVKDQEDDSAITVYTTATGGTPITDPESDSLGHPEGFVESGSYYLHSPDGRFDDQNFEAVTARDLGGRELGYAAITSSFVTTSTTEVDVTGMTVTVTVGSRPVRVIFNAQNLDNSGANISSVVMYEGATVIGSVNPQGTNNFPVMRAIRRAPAAGDYTYKLTMLVVAGTGTLAASAGSPASIQVVEC